MEDLIVVEGWVNNRRVNIFEDYDCNANTNSSDIFSRVRHNLKWERFDMTAENSNKSLIESSENIVLEETLTFEGHLYNLNWLVLNCRYDYYSKCRGMMLIVLISNIRKGLH